MYVSMRLDVRAAMLFSVFLHLFSSRVICKNVDFTQKLLFYAPWKVENVTKGGNIGYG